MKITFNPQVDKYLAEGCMRCKYGGTPQCKVHSWGEELETLRQLVLECGLTEEVKWGVPVYTHRGKNVVNVVALKGFCCIGFFKGVLLTDPHKILLQQGRLQAERVVRFTKLSEVTALYEVLKSYVAEAIALEEEGSKVVLERAPEPLPQELLQAFEEDPGFKKSFYALTPGRQRGYILHFSQPAQVQTRISRIARCKHPILNGVGLNNR